MTTLGRFAPSMITLALMGAGLLTAPVAGAQSSVPAASATAAGRSVQHFQIPSGALAPALRRLASSAHVLLTFSEEQTSGKQTAGIDGTYSFEAALAALLAGSGLQGTALESGGYVLRAVPTTATAGAGHAGAAGSLPVVQVVAQTPPGSAENAYRARTAQIGILGDQSLRDTPYSVNVVTRELMDNLQATSMTEALKTDASVTTTTNNIGGLASQIAVRGVGLDLLNGRKIDGLNVFQWSGDLALEHFEQIQVLKGAGGLLYGFAQPGGIVNFITKRPTDEPLRSVTATVTDGVSGLLHADLGGRFGSDNRFGYRVNLVHENGDTYIKDSRIERTSGSVALDWRITPDLVWSVDALASRRETHGAAGWGLIPNASGDNTDYATAQPPTPIRGDRRIFSPFTSYETEAKVYGTDLAWRIDPDWSARLAYKRTTMDRTYLNGAIYANAAGHYTEEMYAGTDRFETEDLQATVNGRLQTGSLRHDISLGMSTGKNRTYNSSISDYAVLGSGNLSQPGQFANPHLKAGPADTLASDVSLRSVFVADQLHLNEQWSVLLGARHSSLKDSTNGYDRSATTPSLALIFKPSSTISTYASYIESLEQGATAPITAVNAKEVFPPLKSRQVELGVKADGTHWTANAALFRLERGLTYTNNENVFTQSGRARFTGLELAGKVRLSPEWLVHASALLLDAENTRTAPDINGKRVAGTPRQQLSAFAEYRVPQTGWTLLAGARHTGGQPIDAGNTVSLPSVTLVDVGARYAVRLGNTPTTVRLNVDNLANKAYWQTSAATLVQGAPRTVKLSAQWEF